MAYYCKFEDEGVSVPATQVIMDPENGDIVPCCNAHLLGVCMGQITELIGPDALVEFLTTWLQSVMANKGLDTESPDSVESGDGTASNQGTGEGSEYDTAPSVPLDMNDTVESLNSDDGVGDE